MLLEIYWNFWKFISHEMLLPTQCKWFLKRDMSCIAVDIIRISDCGLKIEPVRNASNLLI